MTSGQAAFVVVKGLGLYWIVDGILCVKAAILLPFSYRFTDFGKQAGAALFGLEAVNWVLQAVVYLALGLTFVFRTRSIIRLARFGEAGEDAGPDEGAGDENRYEALAFALIGIYFALPALAASLPVFVRFWQLRHPGDNLYFESYLDKNWERLIGNSAEVALGLALVLGRKGLARLWRSSRPMSGNDPGAA